MHPFTSRHSRSVAALGESVLIEKIKGWLGKSNPRPPGGIGDDCAVLFPSRARQLVTVDPVIYGRHFDDGVAPEDCAAKLLKRNLSDIAAMGGDPVAAVIALALDPTTKIEWIERFYRGLATASRTFDVAIVGGDVAQSEKFLGAFLTLLGKQAGRRVVTRTGAKKGSHIYVTGTLGGSRLGHHLSFTPRLAEGRWLASQAEVLSMMDLSDGLAKDLWALCPQKCEPALDTPHVPISKAAKRISSTTGRSAIIHALTDGEDYELVFTVSRGADLTSFEKRWSAKFTTQLNRIGYFVPAGQMPEGHLSLKGLAGYEHLKK